MARCLAAMGARPARTRSTEVSPQDARSGALMLGAMNADEASVLHCSQLIELARQADGAAACDVCAPLQQRGWESMPGHFDRERLQRVGTLRAPGEDEPTLQEHHPAGTRYWSPDAPIAPAFHPSNRCDVWQCTACGRAFLRYTEYGGYYHDERVRLLDPALIDTTGCV